jgi:Zn-dependent protease with chaperone function
MYYVIGISLLFGIFYATLLTTSLMSVGVWSLLRQRAMRWHGRRRSNVLCALRLIPLIFASTVTLAFVLPAFITFEPWTSSERVGYKLAVVTILSAMGLTAAMLRIFASWWRTRRLIAAWLNSSSPDVIKGFDIPAHRIEHEFPVLAVVGIFHPRVFVAEKVLNGLERSELQASIAHELGHIAARDNLKRIAMRLCSDLIVFPFTSKLDRDWAEAAEAAADESAAGRADALDLASALIKIGRLVPSGSSYKLPAGAYLLEPDDCSLATRIEALVAMPDKTASVVRPVLPAGVLYALVIACIGLVLSLSFNTAFLGLVHDSTEKLLAFLQ